jgi:hypothetical protein
MKKMRIFISISIFVCLVSFSKFSDPLSKILSGFASYVEKLPAEKVYIHFDRPYYSAGDTIWFKTYLTAGAYHEPSSLSNTIYVELINEKGQILEGLKLLAIDGSAAGSISIRDSLPSGNYLIRAYTNWMRNSRKEYFFHRSLKIWNNGIAGDIINNAGDLDVQFFPEGGELVDGIQSKVAVKAVGPDGLGRRVNGKIVEGNTTVCEFRSNSLGMGVFYITPGKNRTYKAIIENYKKEIVLPSAKESGLTLSVNNAPTLADIMAIIQTTDFKAVETVYIVAQTRGIVYYSARINLSSNVAVAGIPKGEIPPGVSQITVTDRNGMPLAERLVFVDRKDQLRFKVTTDKATYAPRELVRLDIQATDASGKPAVADLSLSVCDNQQVLFDGNMESINSYLMLSSELIGHIESPGYYFNPNNEDREEALDHLMLTQGWRRFTFKEALEQKWEPPQYRVEKGLTVKGRMVDQFDNKPIIDGKVTYFSVYPIPQTISVRTNSNGEFELEDLEYYDSTKIMLKGETKRGSKSVKIIVDSLHNYPVLKYPLLPLRGTKNEFEKALIGKTVDRNERDNAYAFNDKIVTLEEVKVRAKRSKRPNSESGIFGKGSVNVIVPEEKDMGVIQHPLQLIQGRVAGVLVRKSGQDWNVLIQGMSSVNAGANPLIMIDDMPVDIESLNGIPVQAIERFRVWKGADAAVFGVRGGNGAIGFYTRKGTNGQGLLEEGLITFPGNGFQFEREFYAPKYDVQEQEHVKPDKRVTLFWEPYIQTDSSGRASVSFYNHDFETTVRGTLEGLSTTGSSGSVNFEYKIIKR